MNDSLLPLNDTMVDHAAHASSHKTWLSTRLVVQPIHLKEAIYQIVIVFVLLVFFSFQMDQSEKMSIQTLFEPVKIAFFANYLAAAMIINYVFLPLFYYRKRNMVFALALSLLLTAVILIDEYILEQIFFPDTRGTYFPGLLYTLVETLPIIIIIVAFKLAWDSNRKQSEVEKLKSLIKESELQFLKSQINPHFLFNNLNNLYAHALDRSAKTPSIILQLSAVLRYMLYDCRENVVGVDREIQHLRNYVALNQLQIENRGSIQLAENIHNHNFSIPPLILIVFVENAFKHSTGTQANNIDIGICIEVSQEGRLTFLCRNNHSEIYRSTDPAKGIGLENVTKRLDLQYPNEYKLDIQAERNTYAVKLTMQLKKTGEL